ncbi:hypothetical protein ES707_09664 [subsurface metagenome]
MTARKRRLYYLNHRVELHRRNSASFRLYVQNCAAVVVEGATVTSLHMEPPPCSRLDLPSTPLALACSAG